MRRIILAGLVALLVLPASARAWSIHNYRVRDAGSQIVHRVTVCAELDRWEPLVRVRTRVEMADDTDTVTTSDDAYQTQEPCELWTIRYRDILRYESWYYGRMRIAIPATGRVRYTRWKRFWAS
jgi:hypothetical protein